MVTWKRSGWLGAAVCAASLALGSCTDLGDPEALVPPTAERDPRLPQVSIEVRGRRRAIHAEAVGDPTRPAVLFLHGSLSDYRGLRVFEPLASAFYLVFWDQRGNGLSERIEEDEYDRDSIVDEIDAIRLHYVGDRPVTLVGHSFGAMYAALYTSTHPERVDGLVLLEPGGLNSTIFNATFDDVIDISLFDLGMNQSFWQNVVLTPTEHETLDLRGLMVLLNGRQTRYHCDRDHPTPIPVWRPGGYVEYLRSKVLGGSAGFSSPTFDFDFARGLSEYPRRVLLLGGTCSALGPAYQARYHAPLFRDAEVVTIPNAGHRMFVEQPGVVVAAVRSYLEGPR